MSPLRGFVSLCPERAKVIVSQENKRCHRARNPQRDEVTHYKIDGIVIKEGNKCDYLLLNETKHHAYLIELKGRDISHAVKQLEETERKLASQLQGYEKKYRIICSKVRTSELKSAAYRSFERRHYGQVVCKEGQYPEDI